jgi:hypothetical protein
MVFEPQTLAPGPGNAVQARATFRAGAISIRFERFTVFHPSTSGGGPDCGNSACNQLWPSGLCGFTYYHSGVKSRGNACFGKDR